MRGPVAPGEGQPALRLDLEHDLGAGQQALHLLHVGGALDVGEHHRLRPSSRHGCQVGAVRFGERALDLERGMHDVDRFAGPDQPARPVLEDQAVAVDGRDPHALAAVGKEGVHRRVDADGVAQPDLGVGRDGGADHPQLPPLEVDPQRLAQGPQPLQGLGRSAPQGHHRVEPQPTHQRVAGHLVEKGRIGWRGDDGADVHGDLLRASASCRSSRN